MSLRSWVRKGRRRGDPSPRNRFPGAKPGSRSVSDGGRVRARAGGGRGGPERSEVPRMPTGDRPGTGDLAPVARQRLSEERAVSPLG